MYSPEGFQIIRLQFITPSIIKDEILHTKLASRQFFLEFVVCVRFPTHSIVKFRINRTLCAVSVRHAGRMNQRYEGSPCGIHRGEDTAKPNLPRDESVSLFLRFTINLGSVTPDF